MTVSRLTVRGLAMAVIVALFIPGCASMGSMYATCDQKNDRFSEVATCTKAALKADSRYGFHNGYITFANRAMAAIDVMEERVVAGTISEREARYKMHELLASMQREIAAQVNAINASMPINSTVKTNCTTYGSNTSCTSR